MPHCAAFGCRFQSKGNKGSDISIHSFPKDKRRGKKWEDACGRTQLPQTPWLCSSHFSPEAFHDFGRPQLMKELTGATGYKRKLKPDAFPTIFPHKVSMSSSREASELRAKKRDREEMVGAILSRRPVSATATSGETSDPPLITDDDLTSPLHTAVSVGTMCRPKMIDAATQTDSLTSDAAVQWPADVQEVFALDHAYPVDMRAWGQEEDTGSLDLFPLEDDFSDDSPLYKDPDPHDPDYILSEFEPSQSSQESHASTVADEENRVFLVFEEQLKQLLQRCLKCGSLIAWQDVKELQNEGSQLTLDSPSLLLARQRGKATCFWQHLFSSVASILLNLNVFVLT